METNHIETNESHDEKTQTVTPLPFTKPFDTSDAPREVFEKRSDATVFEPKKPRYGWFVAGAALIALMMLVQMCYSTSIRNDLNAVEANVGKIQVEKADKSELATKANQTEFASLQATVKTINEGVTKQNTLLEELKAGAAKNLKDITNLTKTKVNQKDLSRLANRNRQKFVGIEQRLEAHINIAAVETAPLPDEEKAPVTTTDTVAPSHNIIYRNKLVEINEYKYKPVD